MHRILHEDDILTGNEVKKKKKKDRCNDNFK